LALTTRDALHRRVVLDPAVGPHELVVPLPTSASAQHVADRNTQQESLHGRVLRIAAHRPDPCAYPLEGGV